MNLATQLAENLVTAYRTRRILLVEDNSDDAYLTKVELETHSCVVTHVIDAESAYHEAEKQRFDVGIIDIGLPLKSGLDLAKELRTQFPNLNIMLYSGSDEGAQTVLRALEEGFTIVSKPFKFEKLQRLSRSLGCQ